jgi:tripartite-type tricarboxylate transporter receptor subunit TctC
VKLAAVATMSWLARAMAIACVALAAAAATAAAADKYPTRPVTIVVPFAPGSVTDAAARLIGQHLQTALGQPFVIENKAGAGGLIAAAFVSRQESDGYTLLLTTNSTHSAANGLYKNVPYDPIKDFAPIARIGSFPSVIVVNPDQPIHTIQELIAYAKANPSKLEYGTGNSTGQIVGETLKKRTDVDIVRVGYRSNPTAVSDLIGGHIAMMIPDFGTAIPQIKDGKMRPLAVLTKQRSPLLPEVPTLDETIMPGYDVLAWAGMFAPANTPPEVIATLAKELEQIVARPDVKEQFVNSGIEPYWGDTEQFSQFVKDELVKWTALIKEAGIEPE